MAAETFDSFSLTQEIAIKQMIFFFFSIRRSLFDVILNLKVVFFLSPLLRYDTLKRQKNFWVFAGNSRNQHFPWRMISCTPVIPESVQ